MSKQVNLGRKGTLGAAAAATPQSKVKGYTLWRCAPEGLPPLSAATVRAAILLLPQASFSNIATVFEDLQGANTVSPEPGAPLRFAPRIVAETRAPRATLSGVTITPHAVLDDMVYDLVITPTLLDDGCMSDPGYGPILSHAERDWLLRQHAGGAFFSTMCSGVFALADAGLLNGWSAAMHSFYAPTFQRRYPEVTLKLNQALMVSGARREFVTGGMSVYSTDVSLFNIAHFFGVDLALKFGRLYGKTWSEALHGSAAVDPQNSIVEDRVVTLAKQFMRDHLGDSGVVGAAAALAHLHPRTFCRRFQRAMGVSPRDYVAGLRFERARELLAESRMPVDDVAAKLGYADRSAFTKAFRARSGLTPAAYRTRFQSASRLRGPSQSSMV